MSDSDACRELKELAAERDEITRRIGEAVANARAQEIGWIEIASCLRRSVTNVHGTYGYVDSPLWNRSNAV